MTTSKITGDDTSTTDERVWCGAPSYVLDLEVVVHCGERARGLRLVDLVEIWKRASGVGLLAKIYQT